MKHRLTPSARAISAVPTVYADSAKRVTVLAAAIRVGPTGDATAAIRGAERAPRRAPALSIFVALVADSALLVAAVSRKRAAHPLSADWEAMVS